MYRAKPEQPGTRTAVAPAGSPGDTNAGELRSTLSARGLSIAYQPVVDLGTGRIVTMEALARWTTPSGTAVAPDVFIPLAEKTGLIGELGSQILAMAARDALSWQQFAPVGVRVNVSADELRSPTFYADAMRTMDTVGLDARLLGVEVGESVLVEGHAGTLDTLAQLHAAGVSLMLDDFGDGYGSLSYLERFPVADMLKVDRSCLADHDRGDAAIERVVELGTTFDLTVCAEGVEDAGQHARVVKHGCDLAQGYYFARPTSGELIPQLLDAWTPVLPL